jgi:predicted DNA-binding transcriptional regulator AlpA
MNAAAKKTAKSSSEYLIRKEVAELLRVHINSIGRWVDGGWLPPPIRLGPGGRWLRWKRCAIEQFLRELEEGKHAQAKR